MIRIDIDRAGAELVMRVAGAMTDQEAGVLREAVARHGVPSRLDLSGVESLDADGRSALLELEVRGAVLVGPTPYVELLLRGPP